MISLRLSLAAAAIIASLASCTAPITYKQVPAVTPSGNFSTAPMSGAVSELDAAKSQPDPMLGVTYHSIMGDRGKGNSPDSSDGVVPYWSSHLDGQASEKIVPSGHSAHENPEGIEEVRRILKSRSPTWQTLGVAYP